MDATIKTMQIDLDFGLKWTAYREPSDGGAPETFAYGTTENAAITALIADESKSTLGEGK